MSSWGDGHSWRITLREILAIEPGAVIFTMSGKDGAEDHNEVARSLGAGRGFRKPVGIGPLLAAVDVVGYSQDD